MSKFNFIYLNRAWYPREVHRRLKQSSWPLLQITLAATVSVVLASALTGSEAPVLAAIVAVASLGFSRDTRFSRVVATVSAMAAGILLSVLLLGLFGLGIWQTALAVLIAGVLARTVTADSTLAVTMMIQALLVQSLPEPDLGYLSRALEGLIGGSVALAFAALLPRNPTRMVREVEARLFTELRETIMLMRSVLKAPKAQANNVAWEHSKGLSSLVDDWRATLQSAESIVNISPFYRQYAQTIRESRERYEAMDLAVRNARMVARRVTYLSVSQQERDEFAALLADFSVIIVLVETLSQDFSARRKAHKQLKKLGQKLFLPNDGRSLSAHHVGFYMQLRPFWVDLAVAAGIEREEARNILI